MKGIVFTEFMDMVEGLLPVDILEKSELPNNGAYTAVGTYNNKDIVRMTANLSQTFDIPVATLLDVFGQHLFGRFSERYLAFLRMFLSHLNF